MAKRLSKALRGKRRWFGIVFSEHYCTRKTVDSVLDHICSEQNFVKKLRLMDFHSAGGKISSIVIESINLKLPKFDSHGFGIVEVPLENAINFRDMLSSPETIKSYGMESLTMSGKIRLVRERLNLPKPKRKK